MTEPMATTTQLIYLADLLAGHNTTWAVVRQRWPDAPPRCEDLTAREAGRLIGTLRRGYLPAHHHPPEQLRC